MTKWGETDGFGASDFLRVITEYLGEGALDWALVSYYEALPREVLARYQREGQNPVSIDQDRCYQYVPRLMVRPLAAAGTLVRHDPDALAAALLAILNGSGSNGSGSSEATAREALSG
jgi:2-phospho-L-lactate transferase/gluconeogenesis factor (CofD/UPF0052 family)